METNEPLWPYGLIKGEWKQTSLLGHIDRTREGKNLIFSVFEWIISFTFLPFCVSFCLIEPEFDRVAICFWKSVSETWLWSGDAVIYCFSNFMISLAVDLKMWLLFLTHNFPSELPHLQPLGGVGPAGRACVSALPQSAGAGIQTAHWRAGGLAGSSPDPSPPLRHRQHQHHWVPGAVRTLVHADSWHGESQSEQWDFCLLL